MNTQTSLKKILFTDYYAFIGWVMPVFCVGVLILQFFIGETLQTIITLALYFAPLSLAGIVLALWRVQVIRRVFDEGLQVPAVVVKVAFFRGRGRVEVVYDYQGERILSRNLVMKNKSTDMLREGMPVVALIDPGKPRRAFVRELYAE